ncbi:MAG: hypothetical protein F4164_06370 [Gemmatimonadales bacterium]|nr:hypothetical protein [Gemmatimonadales bacterium]MYG48985.1 hypothetical protein [Gemmatimonadales bacterium]MYK01855.1 hypothetical protein [Candidatus Palauibacter ramosifaciens]
MHLRLGVVALFFLPAVLQGQEYAPSEDERVLIRENFSLFTDCASLWFMPTVSDPDDELGLSLDRVRTLVRSRLRAAGIYQDADPEHATASRILWVRVTVIGRAWKIRMHISTFFPDPLTDRQLVLEIWSHENFGTHGGDPGFVLGLLSEGVDEFIDEYLRVNEEACSQRR